MAEAEDQWLSFGEMDELEVREWVEANPARVNDRDRAMKTLLYMAVSECVESLILWLVDEKGADVNARCGDGKTALHATWTMDILDFLLDRGAVPTLLDNLGHPPLFYAATSVGECDVSVARLLQDPRVQGTVNLQDGNGYTALHYAGVEDVEATAYAVVAAIDADADANAGGAAAGANADDEDGENEDEDEDDDDEDEDDDDDDDDEDEDEDEDADDIDEVADAVATDVVRLLLQSGADPTLPNTKGDTPWTALKRRHPTYTLTLGVLKQAMRAIEVTSLLVNARRVTAAATASSTAVHPLSSSRVVFPRLRLQRTMTGGFIVEDEECLRLRSALQFVLGTSGGRRCEGMPRDVFRDVFVDLLMPPWDPLRKYYAPQPPSQQEEQE